MTRSNKAWDRLWQRMDDLGHLTTHAVRPDTQVDYGKQIEHTIDRLRETHLTQKQVDEIAELVEASVKAALVKADRLEALVAVEDVKRVSYDAAICLERIEERRQMPTPQEMENAIIGLRRIYNAIRIKN